MEVSVEATKHALLVTNIGLKGQPKVMVGVAPPRLVL
jgi:hypothetical protein